MSAMIGCCCLSLAGNAVTFVVNSAESTPDVTPGDGLALTADGVTTLLAAVDESNALPGTDEILFDMAVLGGEARVGRGGRIIDDIRIVGPGAEALKIFGWYIVFSVDNSAEVEISGLTFERNVGAYPPQTNPALPSVLEVKSGSVTIDACKFVENASDTIYVRDGTLLIKNCTVEGEVVFLRNIGTSTVMGSVFRNNGECIYSWDALSIEGCLFEGNSALAIGHHEGTTTVKDSLLKENVDFLFFADSGTVDFSNVIVTLNKVAYNGILEVRGAALSLSNCSVTENTLRGATGAGGGIILQPNMGGSITIGNTLVAGNVNRLGQPVDVSGAFTSLGGNLIGVGDGATGFDGPGDMVGTAAAPIDPKLGPVWDYGGGLPSVRLLPGSPAIDAGLNSLITNPPFDGPPFYDMRGEGFPRIVNGTVDIGA
ncbi:MAG: right-handed parallel beta-helix repeat-containing protein, partial [Candidatus Hydrogenedentes bacterium]|nr:right-handed parallel beta-helix repeat-containing protein [Candidatus Hydrogenedentota bacterium]